LDRREINTNDISRWVKVCHVTGTISVYQVMSQYDGHSHGPNTSAAADIKYILRVSVNGDIT
jgi:hypothetical protein